MFHHIKDKTQIVKELSLEYYHSDDIKEGNPLLVYLHGSGEAYNNTKEKDEFFEDFSKIVRDINKDLSLCIPRCNPGRIWEPDDIKTIVDNMIDKYKVDKNRIYIMGHSMGARGVWSTICHYPELFAAAVPIAGYSYYLMAKNIIEVPVWCIHGTEDEVVPIVESIKMIGAIKESGGKLTRFSRIKECDHGQVGSLIFHEEIYEWMLSNVKR